MPRMDRARRAGGLGWVVVGLLAQAYAGVVRGVWPGWVTGVLLGAAAVLALAHTPYVLTRDERPARLLGRLVGVLLGASLLGAVADRLGLLGDPGTPGVSWGSWPAFVDYTARMLPDALDGAAQAAAVAATAVEVVLGVLVACGWQRRWVGKACAGLFAAYLVLMLTGVGAEETLRYGVPTLIGGALLVSATPDRRNDLTSRALEPSG